MKVWMLFSVENLYDQPENNLVAWWKTKPTFDDLAKAVGWGQFPCNTDEGTLYIVNLWQGADKKDKPGGTRYRLEEVEEGVVSEGV